MIDTRKADSETHQNNCVQEDRRLAKQLMGKNGSDQPCLAGSFHDFLVRSGPLKLPCFAWASVRSCAWLCG